MTTYAQLPTDGGAPDRTSGSRLLQTGAALGGGACLLLLGLLALSASAPNGASEPNAISMMGLPAAHSPLHTAQGHSPALSGMMGSRLRAPTSVGLSSLPGPSPWKELALTAMDGASTCSRDVSAKARNRIEAVVASMPSRDKAVVRAAGNRAEELAGITGPTGFWDPLGFSTDLSFGRLLFYREVELKHGRICMLAALGILVAEKFHPLFGGDIDLPAYISFQQTPLEKFWYAVAAAIAIPEVLQISSGAFAQPGEFSWGFQMNEDRVPGDLGFDPLGLKPSDPAEFKELQNKEINNGRLAMISVAGMIAQELATGQKLFP